MPWYDYTAAWAAGEIGSAFDYAAAFVAHPLGKVFDYSTAGVHSPVWDAEQWLTINTGRISCQATEGYCTGLHLATASFAGFNRLEITYRSDMWEESPYVYATNWCGFGVTYHGDMRANDVVNYYITLSKGGKNIAMGFTPPWTAVTFDISGFQGTYALVLYIAARGGGVLNWGEAQSARLYNG